MTRTTAGSGHAGRKRAGIAWGAATVSPVGGKVQQAADRTASFATTAGRRYIRDMHPRMTELEEYLGRQRAQLTAAVAQIAASRYRDSPGAERWSVVEVLEHVALVETGLGQSISGWFADAKAAGLGREADSSPILPTIDVDRFVDRSRPVKTSAAMEPSGKLNVDEAMQALARARASFIEVMAECNGYALKEIVHPHSGLGPMHLYEWIAFAGGHMCRHAMQIREIGIALAASGGR